MGKITGFLELARIQEVALPAAGARAELSRVRAGARRRRSVDAGCALHGLRHSVLPERLSGQQRHPGLERSRLPAAMARRARRAALDEQFSGIHRPHLSGALRGGVHAQHQRRCRSASSRSSISSSIAAGTRAGSCRCRRRERPASAWRSSAPDRRVSRARSSWRVRGTTSCSSKRPTALAACCATAFPISRWRST